MKRVIVVLIVASIGVFAIYKGLEKKDQEREDRRKSYKVTPSKPQPSYNTSGQGHYTINTKKGIKNILLDGISYPFPTTQIYKVNFKLTDSKDLQVEPIFRGHFIKSSGVKIKKGGNAHVDAILVTDKWTTIKTLKRGQIITGILQEDLPHSVRLKYVHRGKTYYYDYKSLYVTATQYIAPADGEFQVRSHDLPLIYASTLYNFNEVIKGKKPKNSITMPKTEVYTQTTFHKRYKGENKVYAGSSDLINLDQGGSKVTPFWLECGDTIELYTEIYAWETHWADKSRFDKITRTRKDDYKTFYTGASCPNYVRIESKPGGYFNRVIITRDGYNKKLRNGDNHTINLETNDEVAIFSNGNFYINNELQKPKVALRVKSTDRPWKITVRGAPNTGQITVYNIKRRGY